MSADGTGQPPPAGGQDDLRTAGHRGGAGFGERLGQTGRRVLVTVLVLAGVVLAFVIGRYVFANSWTTHVVRAVDHSTFHGFWYGGWFAFVSVLIAAILVRLAFARRLHRVVRIVAAVLALFALVPEMYTVGISLSESRPGTNAGRIHNDAPGYIGGQYTGLVLGLAAATALFVLTRRWRKDRVLAKGARTARTSPPDAPPPGGVAVVERSLNGGFEGGPDGLAFVTDRELFGSVRVRLTDARTFRRPSPRSERVPRLCEDLEFVVVDLLFGRTF